MARPLGQRGSVFKHLSKRKLELDKSKFRLHSITGTRGTDLPPPFFLTFCLQIYFQQNFFISLLFTNVFFQIYQSNSFVTKTFLTYFILKTSIRFEIKRRNVDSQLITTVYIVCACIFSRFFLLFLSRSNNSALLFYFYISLNFSDIRK
jgi:hypothetical protein